MSTTVFICRPLRTELKNCVKYKCISCNKKFDSRDDYESHRKESHNEQIKKSS